ncbi:carcinoembryonic antigen-related cell adhesion molecule 3-like [Elgaria multicarinata webbii]|uniref:carcinoembryonic antigen-related cell adhesion molecule 3-like n=1 Tax=Elgaria multicarinata webbii TaxID=159646 RepID=UPI002FCD51EC
MNLPSSQQGLLKAILRAGFILALVLQVVPAQQSFSVNPQPRHPKWGQNVTLQLVGAPPSTQIVECQWGRSSPTESQVSILTYTPQRSPKITNGHAFSGRETLGKDCVLHITWLTRKDTGNYTVTIQTAASKENENLGSGPRSTASAFVDISEPTSVRIEQNLKDPRQGQTVNLNLQNPPKRFSVCEWSKETGPGFYQIVQTYVPGQRNPQESKHTVKEDCSISIKDLNPTDDGIYMARIEVPLEPQKDTENPERREDSRVYMGRVTLKVLSQATKNDPQKGGSASLGYNAGVLVATLLGSLAWADPLMAMFSMVFCPFASLRSKFLP